MLWAVVRSPSASGFVIALLGALVCMWLSATDAKPQCAPAHTTNSTCTHLTHPTHASLYAVCWQVAYTYLDQWVLIGAAAAALQFLMIATAWLMARSRRSASSTLQPLQPIIYHYNDFQPLTTHPDSNITTPHVCCVGHAPITPQPVVPEHWPSPHFKAVNMSLPGGEARFLSTHKLEKDDEHGWHYGNHPSFSAGQRNALRAMLKRNLQSFAFKTEDLRGYTGRVPPMVITLKPDANKSKMLQQKRRFSPAELEAADKHNAELLRCNLIGELSLAEFACNSVIVPKKDADGNWTGFRVCQDYRDINEGTVGDNYRLPLPEDLWDKVKGSTIFSKIDLRSGFFQLPMDPESAKLTGFWWGNRCF